MQPKKIESKINGKKVKGKGHLQPEKNNWIGVFEVTSDLLDNDYKHWKAAIVEYEGFFTCKEEATLGKGKGEIIHIRPTSSNKVIINIEGIERPSLKNKSLENSLRIGYNVNLSYS